MDDLAQVMRRAYELLRDAPLRPPMIYVHPRWMEEHPEYFDPKLTVILPVLPEE